MAKYAAMRIPLEFKLWLDMRKMNIARALGVHPSKIKYPRIMRMIIESGPIYLDDNIIKKFAPRRKGRML